MLNGGMTLPQRKKALSAFKADPDTRVFLLTMRSGSVGINLTQANHVFMLEPSFNPALVQQAIARAWRLGQRKKVDVVHMYVPHSVEQRLLERNRRMMGKTLGANVSSSSSSSSSTSSTSSSSSSSSSSALVVGSKRKRNTTNTDQVGSITGDSKNLKSEEFLNLFDNSF